MLKRILNPVWDLGLGLGFILISSDFTRAVNIDAMSAALKHGIVKSAVNIKSSFDIYCKRNHADPIAP